jgi:hypothetical protein
MKIQAVKIHRVVNPENDREINFPFKCFACHDGGLAGGRFVAEFVDGDSDIPFLCNRDQCEAGRIRRTAWLANESDIYRNSFDTRLDRYACEDIHNWEKEHYLQTVVKKMQSGDRPIDIPALVVFDKFQESVADRNSQILEIKKAIATAETQGVNLKNKIAVTVKRCSDRDKRLYQSWEFLPNEDHARMLAGIQDLIRPKVDEEYYAAIDF